MVYISKFEDAIYVLHAFQKKTRKTRKTDIDTAKLELKALRERGVK